jgi:glutathione peroxidase
MKTLLTILIATTAFFMKDTLVHDFKVNNIDGNEINLADYKGKVLLIVNTASKCGFTPQYDDLQTLYKKYEEQGLVVIGFPANNFGGQEPGTDEEIKTFCLTKFDVEFPMMSKVSVKGKDIHPLFAKLISAESASIKGDINWNFEKFLIDKDGNLVERYRSRTKPLSDDLTTAIETELAK